MVQIPYRAFHAEAHDKLGAHARLRGRLREVDYVRPGQPWIEVKAGRAPPFEFDWFPRAFPRQPLLVVNTTRFNGEAVRGVTLEDFLMTAELPAE